MAAQPPVPPSSARESFNSIPSQTNLANRTTLDDIGSNGRHNKLLSWSFSRKSFDSDRDSYAESLNSLSTTLKERLRQNNVLLPSPTSGRDIGSPKSNLSFSDDNNTPTGSPHAHSGPHGGQQLQQQQQQQPQQQHQHQNDNSGNKKKKKKMKSPHHSKMASVTFSSTVSLFSESDKRKNSLLFFEVHGVPANITNNSSSKSLLNVDTSENHDSSIERGTSIIIHTDTLEDINGNSNKNNQHNKPYSNENANRQVKPKSKRKKGRKFKAKFKGKSKHNDNDNDNEYKEADVSINLDTKGKGKAKSKGKSKKKAKIGSNNNNNNNNNNNSDEKKNENEEKTQETNGSSLRGRRNRRKGKGKKQNNLTLSYLEKLRKPDNS